MGAKEQALVLKMGMGLTGGLQRLDQCKGKIYKNMKAVFLHVKLVMRSSH